MQLQLLVSSLALTQIVALPTCKIPDTSAGQHDGKCQGIKYTYRVPATCAGNACGLIVDVHGWTMNGDAQDANTGTRALGEKHGFVVVQPTAPIQKYHGSVLSLLPLTSWETVDYPKVWTILEAVRDEPALHVDPERVHFMGFSQGATMTWWMLQHHSEELASAAPLSCAAGNAQAVAAHAASVPVLQSHGYKDRLCPFDEGNATFQTLKSEWSLSEAAVLSQDEHHVRRAFQGPNGQYMETLFWDYESGRWGGLVDSIAGILYKKIGDGHCFPGSSDTHTIHPLHPRVSFPERLCPFACPAPDSHQAAFVIGEVAVQFFLGHPRNGSRSFVV